MGVKHFEWNSEFIRGVDSDLVSAQRSVDDDFVVAGFAATGFAATSGAASQHEGYETDG